MQRPHGAFPNSAFPSRERSGRVASEAAPRGPRRAPSLDTSSKDPHHVVDIRQHDVSPAPADRLQGTLALLILRILEREPLHGWAISRRIRLCSGEQLQVNQGSLYPALHRLEEQGWVDAEWGVVESGKRAKMYRLTAAGRRHLTREEAGWREFVHAVTRVLETA